MKLKDYLNQNHIPHEKFALDLKISYSCLGHYFSGIRKPTQKRAESIEAYTKGAVTVKDMRGKDARKR